MSEQPVETETHVFPAGFFELVNDPFLLPAKQPSPEVVQSSGAMGIKGTMEPDDLIDSLNTYAGYLD